MNCSRIFLAALGAFVAYFAAGGAASAVPSLREEFLNYPAVYRSREGIMSVLPYGMAAMFVAKIALAALYSMLYKAGSGMVPGAGFGALIGIYRPAKT